MKHSLHSFVGSCQTESGLGLERWRYACGVPTRPTSSSACAWVQAAEEGIRATLADFAVVSEESDCLLPCSSGLAVWGVGWKRWARAERRAAREKLDSRGESASVGEARKGSGAVRWTASQFLPRQLALPAVSRRMRLTRWPVECEDAAEERPACPNQSANVSLCHCSACKPG